MDNCYRPIKLSIKTNGVYSKNGMCLTVEKEYAYSKKGRPELEIASERPFINLWIKIEITIKKHLPNLLTSQG